MFNWKTFVGAGAVALGMSTQAFAVECPRDGALIAGASDYRPYQKVDGKEISGMDFEVIGAVLEKLGCRLDAKALPWARHLKGIEDGDVDIASPVSKTAEREAFANFSSPYVDAQEVLFVRAGNEGTYSSLADFFEKGGKLGTIREYAYGGDFSALKDKYAGQIQETDSQESNLKKLAAGRIDATLGEVFVVSEDVKRLGFSDKVTKASFLISSDPSYIMFSKKSVPAEFVAAFSEQMQAMKASGEFEAITAKYK
ncbi:substrate-binding periplasmic protein [Roseibium sp.]|uniref:substrate-binding periplasmic protein n=1 Tax=Roseibium sp. TaxID=1936156 RepID=UPI003B523FB6